ncbi:MAG: FAD:protein FMN transferase [Lachnospiraceae bacterium]|nr:FAD:protein FMN transferase [Lachnospiraceae bacterium]
MKSCIRKSIMFICCIVGISCVLSGCGRKSIKVTATNTAMGTVVQYSLYVSDEKNGEVIITELQDELERLEKEYLSWRMVESQVAKINQQAGQSEGTAVDEALYEYLEQIWRVSKESDGALDVTVGNVTALWNLDEWSGREKNQWQKFQVPGKVQIEALLKNTGFEKVKIGEGKIQMPQDMSLDLGAVGKGIACDRIGDYLKSQKGIQGAVISVGGSVVTYGSKPDGSAWNVAIMHPREEGTYLGTLSLQGEWYIATSGDYERYVEKEGKRYHHIMNPKTGYPADSGLCSVTILSDSGLLSDTLSTACFVLGKEDGLELAQKMEVEALFVTTELKILMTDGMKKYFEES